MTTLFKTFYYFFIVALIAVGALLLVSVLPIPGNIEMKIVQSGSMEPSLPVGSLVVIKPSVEYRAGDIITFGADTKTQVPTTHRILEARSEGGEQTFTTKGDANEEADPETVRRGDVIGKVVAHVPVLGYVLDFARTPLGFTLLVGVPAVMVIVDEALVIIREVLAYLRRRRTPYAASAPAKYDHDTDEPLLPPTPQRPTVQRGQRYDPMYEHNASLVHEARPLVRAPLLDGVVRTGRTVMRPSYSFHEALVTGYQVVLR